MTINESIINDLTRANQRLIEVLAMENTEVNQDATIQRFEFTFELAWKLMQQIVQENKRSYRGVKDIIRQSAELNLISSPEDWFQYLEYRNLTSHTYKAEIARTIYSQINNFPKSVDELLAKAKDFN